MNRRSLVSRERSMNERDVRKMLRQNIRGEYVLRPLDEFVVTHTRKEPDIEHEHWTFSWDGATLQLPSSTRSDPDPR
jgi:hypothetical protein